MLIFVVYHRGKFSGKGKEEIFFLPPLFEKSLRKDKSVKMSNFKIEPANEIVLTLFPEKKTLKLLHQYYSQKQESIHKTIANKLYLYL